MHPTTIHYPPLTAAERVEFLGWSDESRAYLRDRAAAHGLTPEELLAEFPPDHRGEELVMAALPDLEISHVFHQMGFPFLRDSTGNIVLELSHELGGRNQMRGNRVMEPQEVADVQSQTEAFLDARRAELAGMDPLSLGQEGLLTGRELAPVAGVDPIEFQAQMEAVFTDAGWQQGLSNVTAPVLEFLEALGVPVAAVVARGASSVWPFLRSIQWQRFVSDWRYALKTLTRAMRVWREGGWKEACRCIVLGVMIAMLPSLSAMVAALGLTGLGAMGARWLADRRFMQGTQLGTVLIRVAEVLNLCRRFLASAFRLVERVADVVVDAASKVVKRVATTVADGTRQVMAICSEIATTAVRATRSVARGAGEIARGLFGWVSGWFSRPRYA